MECTPDHLIERLQLIPHPEGGWYRELHRSTLEIRRCTDGASRNGLTLIAYLLGRDAVSRWHRLNGSDEIWLHAAGDPLELWALNPQGGRAKRTLLGPADRDEPGIESVARIPAGWWQAARSRGNWTLVHCCVGPGFDFADFSLLGERPAAEHPAGAMADLL